MSFHPILLSGTCALISLVYHIQLLPEHPFNCLPVFAVYANIISYNMMSGSKPNPLARSRQIAQTISGCKETPVLRLRILQPYVPLRFRPERERPEMFVQSDGDGNESRVLTPTSFNQEEAALGFAFLFPPGESAIRFPLPSSYRTDMRRTRGGSKCSVFCDLPSIISSNGYELDHISNKIDKHSG